MSKEEGIVLDSNQEEIEQLARKWRHKKRLGERLLKIGGSGFLISMLSPFDFEGPVAEIVTAAITAVGYGLKETAEYHLDNIEEDYPSVKTR